MKYHLIVETQYCMYQLPVITQGMYRKLLTALARCLLLCAVFFKMIAINYNTSFQSSTQRSYQKKFQHTLLQYDLFISSGVVSMSLQTSFQLFPQKKFSSVKSGECAGQLTPDPMILKHLNQTSCTMSCTMTWTPIMLIPHIPYSLQENVL